MCKSTIAYLHNVSDIYDKYVFSDNCAWRIQQYANNSSSLPTGELFEYPLRNAVGM